MWAISQAEDNPGEYSGSASEFRPRIAQAAGRGVPADGHISWSQIMNGGPSVIVNKGGFFSSLAKGFFGLLTVTVICVTVVGLYGVRTADQQISRVISIVNNGVPAVLEVARGWQEALPPALKDALNDRRAFDYCSQLDVRTSVRDVQRHEHQRLVAVAMDITNRGDEVVSLLGLHLLIEGEGVHTYDRTVYAATPLAIEDEWRGPLLPGQTRRVVTKAYAVQGEPEVKVDVVELRLWNGPAEDHQPVAAVPAPPAVLPAPEAPKPAPSAAADERKPTAADNAASPPAAVEVPPQPVAAATAEGSDD